MVASVEVPAAVAVAERECPWPFIFLHDPAAGLHRKHCFKNAAVAAGLVLLLFMRW